MVVSSAGVADVSIDEIMVTAPSRERRALQPAVEMDRAEIAERVPVALTDIFKSMPSVGIRTNSRGEAVLRLRGSEERQTGIFLDGAPLAVPWDGRVDLSALPAGVVDSVRVSASAAPVEYGPNTVLGTVDIRTRSDADPGLVGLQADIGLQHARSISASAAANTGSFQWFAGAGYRELDGEAVSDPGAIPFGPIVDGYRANTDLKSSSIFVAAGREFDNGAARLSLFSVNADRGIANAGHIDPDTGSPRYWRYPDWRFDQLTLNAGWEVGDSASIRTTAWLQMFEQTIDQYSDDSYTVLESREEDEDQTLGLRMVLERPFESLEWRLVGNAQLTWHDQVDTDFTTGTVGPLTSYQQNIYSLGTEVDTSAGDDFLFSASLSYDFETTPKTGGREPQEDLSDWAASVAARWFPGEQWQVAGTLGQRTRFPSLRELYGEALGEFILNPDLQPETALLGDLTFEFTTDSGELQFRVTPWILHIDNTLSRRNVTVDGARKRQRYNLVGSYGHGLEAGLDWNVGDRFELRMHGNWQDLKAEVEADGTRPVLLQRPDFQAAVVFDWLFADDWDVFIEMRYLGTALDEDEDGSIVELPTSTAFNVRVFRTLDFDGAGRWRLYAGVDNVGDELILPQLGLPQPGLTTSVGVTFEQL
jgi:iron complex outermembrane receptor protein